MALTEVYEVATFYSHFDVVKEGETPPPAVTVRVCDSLSCAMAGAENLLGGTAGEARAGRARGARALHGRLRPRAGLRGRPCADVQCRDGESRRGRGEARACACLSDAHGVRRLSERGRLWAAEGLPRRQAHARRRYQDGQRCRPARPRRRRISDRTQMVAGARRAGAAPVRGQCRRGRARHLQGPLLSRARPAPLHRRHADRGMDGRGRRDLSLYPRRISRTDPDAASKRSPRSRPPVLPTTPRCICAAAPALISAAKNRR